MKGETSVIHIPAGLGIDESTAPEHVQFGKSNLAQKNVRIDQTLSLSARPGYGVLSNSRLDGGVVTEGLRLFQHNGSPALMTSTEALFYVEARKKWRSHGRIPECAYRVIEGPSYWDSTVEDVTYANGFYCVSHRATTAPGVTSSVVTIIDAKNEEVVYQTQLFGTTADNCFVAAANSIFYAVWTEGIFVRAAYFDTISFSGWNAMGSLKTDRDPSTQAQFAIEQLDDRVAGVYVNSTSGTQRITVFTFNSTGVLETNSTITTLNAVVGEVDVAGRTGDTLWVAWSHASSNNVRLCGVSPTSINTTTATTLGNALDLGVGDPTVQITIIPTTTGSGRILAQNQDIPDSITMRGFTTAGGSTSATTGLTKVYNCWLASRGFFKDGRCYVQLWSGDRNTGQTCIQQQLVLTDVTDDTCWLRPVVHHSQQTSGVSIRLKAKTVQGSNLEKYYTVTNRRRTASSVSADIGEYDFSTVTAWEPAAHQGATFFAGSVPTYTDGDQLYEANFAFRPPPALTNQTGASGYTTTNGGYRYIYGYEHIDATGALTLSGLSDPSPATGNFTSKSVQIYMAPMTITYRHANAANSVRIGLYRTTDGGKVFYRIATLSFDGTASDIGYLDSGANSDTAIASNAKAYRQPGVQGAAQDKRPPPAFEHLVEFNGMLVGSFNGSIYWTGQPVDGEGPWWSPIFARPVPSGEKITGLKVLEGNLFVFLRDRIFVTTGAPPTDNASSGGLDDLRLIASDTGCVDSRSLVATGQGIFFRSDRGIELLSRDGSVTWLGYQVQGQLEAYPIVSSAVLDGLNDQVRITLGDGANNEGDVGDAGVTLHWNNSLALWESVDETTIAAVPLVPTVSACMTQIAGTWRYSFLTADGLVYRETTSNNKSSDNLFQSMSYETPWIKLGLQQDSIFYTIQILYERLSNCGLTVELAYNYGAYSDTKVWTEAELTGRSQIEAIPKNEAWAVRVRLTTTAPTGTLSLGQGLRLIGLSVDAAPRSGSTKGTPNLADTVRK